jgi:hypothetical protein
MFLEQKRQYTTLREEYVAGLLERLDNEKIKEVSGKVGSFFDEPMAEY